MIYQNISKKKKILLISLICLLLDSFAQLIEDTPNQFTKLNAHLSV